MSGRLTTEYTDNSEGAFGRTGAIGDKGEIVALHILQELGFDVTHFPNDRLKQDAGHDLEINSTDKVAGVDVKTNLHTGHDVCVDWPKLKKSEATFWFHLNPDDPSDYIMYKVKDMKNYIKSYKGKLYWVERDIANNL